MTRQIQKLTTSKSVTFHRKQIQHSSLCLLVLAALPSNPPINPSPRPVMPVLAPAPAHHPQHHHHHHHQQSQPQAQFTSPYAPVPGPRAVIPRPKSNGPPLLAPAPTQNQNPNHISPYPPVGPALGQHVMGPVGVAPGAPMPQQHQIQHPFKGSGREGNARG